MQDKLARLRTAIMTIRGDIVNAENSVDGNKQFRQFNDLALKSCEEAIQLISKMEEESESLPDTLSLSAGPGSEKR